MPNHSVDQPAAFVLEVNSDHRQLYSLIPCKDLRENYILMRHSETFMPGAEVIVRFVLPVSPEGIELTIPGVVARTLAGVYMAIMFRGIREDQRQAIATFAGRFRDNPTPSLRGGE